MCGREPFEPHYRSVAEQTRDIERLKQHILDFLQLHEGETTIYALLASVKAWEQDDLRIALSMMTGIELHPDVGARIRRFEQ